MNSLCLQFVCCCIGPRGVPPPLSPPVLGNPPPPPPPPRFSPSPSDFVAACPLPPPPPEASQPCQQEQFWCWRVLVCGSVVTEKNHQRIGVHFAVTSPCVEPPALCYQALTSLVADTIFPSLPRCGLAAASYQLAQCFCFKPVGSSRPSGDPLRGWGDGTFH